VFSFNRGDRRGGYAHGMINFLLSTKKTKTLGTIQPIINPKCLTTNRKSTLSPVFIKAYRQSTKIQMSQIHLHIHLGQKRQTRRYIKSGNRDRNWDWDHYLVKQQALTEKARLNSLEWHRVVLGTPLAFVSDIYIYKWECSYNAIKSFPLFPCV